MNPYPSWGNLPSRPPRRVFPLADRHALLPRDEVSLIPQGNGRSYGDVCLNGDGGLVLTRALDRFLFFDAATGVLRCEAGVLLSDILALAVPQGWFLPVTPGTQFVTVGGAIANDVHGKNHHGAGTFGCHVGGLELLRSDGSRSWCSPEVNREWFAATVGGLGLTGLITWAELRLIPIHYPFLSVTSTRFGNLDEFFAINQAAEAQHTYTVAWIDCLAKGPQLGRGIFMAGDHAGPVSRLPKYRSRPRNVPVQPPISLINNLSLRLFNAVYARKPLGRPGGLMHYEPYFYPLDAVQHWNRLYGRKGFYQYQCVLPPAVGRDGVAAMLRAIAKSGQGSFLAVLKTFGDVPSPGMLSFPQPGVTLALDFPNLGDKTRQLFQVLDSLVAQAGGRLYPAKDARMPASLFRQGYPQWERFQNFIDPQFSSDFRRRMME